MKARTLWHNKTRSWIESDNLKEPKSGELLIKSLFSMVSQGTERTVITQNLSSGVAERMAIPYMQGSLMDTFTYGYSLVGEVVSGDESLIGRRVHLIHPHQDYLRITTNDIFLIPDTVDSKTATLASNMETVVNAIWDAEINLGDKVLVMGYGLIGGLIATVLSQMPGVRYAVVETDSFRRKILEESEHAVFADTDGIEEFYDVVFNTTSNESALQRALEITGDEGRIIELSWYGGKNTILKLGADFHYGRKQIISSQVSQIPFKKQPRWNYFNRKELGFELLSKLDFTSFISSEITFEETPEFYLKLRNNEVQHLNTIIHY